MLCSGNVTGGSNPFLSANTKHIRIFMTLQELNSTSIQDLVRMFVGLGPCCQQDLSNHTGRPPEEVSAWFHGTSAPPREMEPMVKTYLVERLRVLGSSEEAMDEIKERSMQLMEKVAKVEDSWNAFRDSLTDPSDERLASIEADKESALSKLCSKLGLSLHSLDWLRENTSSDN